MPTIIVKKTADLGFNPVVTVEVQAPKFFGSKTFDLRNSTYVLSRVLTETDTESGNGIFSNGAVEYQREEVKVIVIQESFPFQGTAEEIARAIYQRTTEVKKAFEKKLPHINEVATIEF